MPTSQSKLTLLLLAFVVVVAGGYYWFNLRDTSDAAIKRLNAQNIEVNTANFFTEIKAEHSDNIRDFLRAGASPGMQDEKGVSALMAAVDTGDKNSLSLLLLALPRNPQEAVNTVNLQDNTEGKTALIIAVEKNDADSASVLLAHSADTAAANKALQTPMMIAVKNKNAGLLKTLIAADQTEHQGTTINAEDAHGETALLYAIRAQSKEMLDMLIAAKADAVSPDRSGVNPLMIAAEVGDEAIGARLIESGAKADSADKSGNSPLSIAIRHSHPGFVRLLIDKGANPDFHTTGTLPLEVAINTEPFDATLFETLLLHSKQAGNLDASILFDAISHKNAALAKTLLDHGISAKAVNPRGETLLYQAIENGLEDAALELIDKGADINQTGVPGITPIERATKHNEIKVVTKLLSLGVSPDQKTSEGYNLAEMAVYSGYPEVLDALLAKGARLEKNFGILWAIRDGGGRSVPVLLKYGANPNVMSNSGEPALWLAASTGEVEAVAALIKYRAVIDYPNTSQGMTPLAIASHGGQLAAVRLLVDAGAKLEAGDASGMTPLAQAAYMTKPDVVEYLLSKGANARAADRQGRSVADLAALGEASRERDRVIALLRQKK
jgi:ankyrin repeat protein